MPLRLDACVAQHIGDRAEQQDRAAVLPHPSRPGTVLAVVADGMGGHTGGAIAAEQVVHKAKQSFETYAPGSETPAELLKTIIDDAHLVIKLTRFTSEQDPHSTAVVLMLQPTRVDWAYCGDSRVYHYRGAALVSKSDDHSLVGEMLRQKRITPDQARVHPQRNLLLHCLGDERDPKIDFGNSEGLVGGDSFVLCSDGLWGYFTDEEIGEVISTRGPRAACEALVELARHRARGGGDNISLVVIKATEEKPAPETRKGSGASTPPPFRFK